MYVLSVEDIDLMIALASNNKLPSELVRHEKQMDKLICMGIIRPGGGVLALTELGYKTAYGLMGRCLGSVVDGPTQPQPAATVAESGVTHEADSEGSDNTITASASENSDDSGSAVAAESGAESAADSDAAAEPA